MLFDLDFANNIILTFFFFFFFLIIHLYFLIPVVIAQMFSPCIPIGTPTNKGKTEMETYPVTVKFNMSKCSV